MRMLFLSLLLLFLGGPVTGCDDSEADTPDAVFLRVEDASSCDFSSVQIRFPGDEVHLGAVSTGQASKYRRVPGSDALMRTQDRRRFSERGDLRAGKSRASVNKMESAYYHESSPLQLML